MPAIIAQPWPSTVNTNINQGGYGEKPEANNANFQPEVGPPKYRRRTSIPTTIYSWTGWFTSAEYDAIVAFYRTTLLDGTVPFMFPNQRTGATDTFQFTDAPAITGVQGITYTVSLPVRKIADEIVLDVGDGVTLLDIGDGTTLRTF